MATGLAVIFIKRAHKVVSNLKATQLAKDVEYRNQIFEQVLAIDNAVLKELALDLRAKLDLNQSVTSCSVYKYV